MRGYLTKGTLPSLAIRASGTADPLQQLRGLIMAALPQGESPILKQVELYYIRQVTGQTDDGQGVIYYFTPEFAYFLDIGYPRYVIVSLPYQVPTEKIAPAEYRTIGLGDAHFPDFKEAELFSAAGRDRNEILFPAKAKELLIGVKEGVSEGEVRAALEPYVQKLESHGTFYLAEVHAFRETEIAKKIEDEVDLVRYAELNGMYRDFTAPWFLDRVL